MCRRTSQRMSISLLRERSFFLAVLSSALVLAAASFDGLIAAFRNEDLLANGFHSQLILTAGVSETLRIALPVISVLPGACSYVDELKCGFLKEYLPRIGYRPYIAGKILGNAVSGGLAPVCGVWIAWGVSALVFLPREAVLPEGETAENYFAKILLLSLLMFLNGSLWATVGLASGAASESRYMAYASPFILYYLLIILCERYVPELYVLYPAKWLGPAGEWPFKEAGLSLWLLELQALAAFGFAGVAERRLRNL